MKTIADISAEFFYKLTNLYDAYEINSLCNIALEDIAGISSARIKAFPELEIPPEKAEAIASVLTRLKTGEPIQYILGHTEFYGLLFKVNPSVLIPRPETEELVDWIISTVRGSQVADADILDMGTGSGCIAVSLKKNLIDSQVSAIDISTDALKIAKENADVNQVEVKFIEEDILNLPHHLQSITHYSLIVSNPPYVTMEDKAQMHTNVTDFEPHTALFVPEDDPLIFYKAIADFASDHLRGGGLLFFEINENFAKQTAELLTYKKFINIELRKDINGRDRMIKAQRSGILE